MTPEELARLRRARDLLDREYAKPLDVPAMARAALMSPSHFARQFRAAYGETPYGYLMTRRIERVKVLLRRGDRTVTEACVEVGCTSLDSFSARFTELVGETPSAYRARRHDATATVPACVARTSHGPMLHQESFGTFLGGLDRCSTLRRRVARFVPTSAPRTSCTPSPICAFPWLTRDLRTVNAWSRSSSTDYATAPTFSGRDYALLDISHQVAERRHN